MEITAVLLAIVGGLFLWVVLAIGFAELAARAGPKWGTPGWLGSWLIYSLTVTALFHLNLRRVRGADGIATPVDWAQIELSILAVFTLVAFGVEALLIRRQHLMAAAEGHPIHHRRAGCLGFALGAALVLGFLLIRDALALFM